MFVDRPRLPPSLPPSLVPRPSLATPLLSRPCIYSARTRQFSPRTGQKIMRIGGQCMSVQWKRMGSGLSLLISLYLFLSSLARSEPLKSPIGTEQVDCLTDGGRIATTRFPPSASLPPRRRARARATTTCVVRPIRWLRCCQRRLPSRNKTRDENGTAPQGDAMIYDGSNEVNR